MDTRVKEAIEGAEMLLIGIGEDFSSWAQAEKESAQEREDKLIQAYTRLRELAGARPYFVITQQTDGLIFRSGLEQDLVTAPCGSGGVQDDEAQWQKYTKWLQCTLNRRLCVLELGAGFLRPDIIRFPFERIAFYNQKSVLVRVNGRFPQLTEELSGRGLRVAADPVPFLLTLE